MTQDINMTGLAASLYVGTWNTNGPTYGELMYDGGNVSTSSKICLSKFISSGSPATCFSQLISGDNIVIVSVAEPSRIASLTCGDVTDLGSYVRATVSSVYQPSYFLNGELLLVTVIKRGDPGLMTDAILTDGTEVLIDADGNVLST